MRKVGWREVVENGLVCHHKDGDKTNNDQSNLTALTPEEHGRIHAEDREWAEDGGFLPMAEEQSSNRQAALD